MERGENFEEVRKNGQDRDGTNEEPLWKIILFEQRELLANCGELWYASGLLAHPAHVSL